MKKNNKMVKDCKRSITKPAVNNIIKTLNNAAEFGRKIQIIEYEVRLLNQNNYHGIFEKVHALYQALSADQHGLYLQNITDNLDFRGLSSEIVSGLTNKNDNVIHLKSSNETKLMHDEIKIKSNLYESILELYMTFASLIKSGKVGMDILPDICRTLFKSTE